MFGGGRNGDRGSVSAARDARASPVVAAGLPGAAGASVATHLTRIVDIRESVAPHLVLPPDGWAHELRQRGITVSIVIPAMNEAANLRTLLPLLPVACEIIVVDGRSHDGTLDVARDVRPDALILTQRGHGKGDALLTGLAAASGDIIVTLDADGSTDPAEVPRFLVPLLEGADFAKGSRRMKGGGSADLTPVRMFGNAGLRTCFNLLYRRSFTDLCYGYNAFWRHCLQYIPENAVGFEFETSVHVAMALAPIRVVEVASYEHSRWSGSSNLRPLRDGWRVLRTIARGRSDLRRTALAVAARPVAIDGIATANGNGSHRIAADSAPPREEPRDRRDDQAASSSGVLRNTVANFAGQAATLLVWFALTPFMLHRLGPAHFAMWVLASSVVAYGTLLDLGVGAAVTKYVAEYRARGDLAEARALVATALRLYCLFGAVAAAVGIAFSGLAPHVFGVSGPDATTLRNLVAVSAIGLGVQLPAGLTYAVLRGLQNYVILNVLGCLASVTLAAAIVTVLVMGGGVVAIAAVMVPLIVVWQLPALRAIKRIDPGVRIGWAGARRDLLRKVGAFSSWLLLINTAGMIKRKTDEIVIAASLPVARVAPYAIARRLSEIPELVTYQFVKLLMPLASHLHGRDEESRLREMFVVTTRVSLAIFIPPATALLVLPDRIIAAWVGPQFAGSARVLLILVASSLIDFAVWPAASIMQGTDRHRLIAIVAGGSALMNLALSLVLVRIVGVVGVALGTLIATVAEMSFAIPYALRVYGISARRALRDIAGPVLLPAVPAAVTLLAIRAVFDPRTLVTLAASGLVSGAVYVIVYLSLKVTAPERRLIGRARESLRVRPGARS